MKSQSILVKAKSLDYIFHSLQNSLWLATSLVENINLVPMSVDPCGYVEGPLRNVSSALKLAKLSPLGVRQYPISVNHGGIKPVALKRLDQDWIVYGVKVIALCGVDWNLTDSKSCCIVGLLK